MRSQVYLDNAATTPATPAVCDAVLGALSDVYGNPSSLHTMGLAAERLVRDSRRTLASYLGVPERGVVFTGGGTESINQAILGVARAYRRRGQHVVTSAVEHAAVLSTCDRLERAGWRVTRVGVDELGRVSPSEVAGAVGEDTVLVSIMSVNNEVGTIQPIGEIVSAVRAQNAQCIIHSDAVQALGKIEVTPLSLGVDLMSFSAHKIHGPKGCGALWAGERVHLEPLMFGGGQEKGLRPGTENVPGIAGFGAAVKEFAQNGQEIQDRMFDLRNKLIEGVLKAVPEAVLNGPREVNVAPHICSLSFPGHEAEVLARALAQEGLFVSTGAACSSRRSTRTGSHVLTAMGVPETIRSASLRFSLSSMTDDSDIEGAILKLTTVLAQLRPSTR